MGFSFCHANGEMRAHVPATYVVSPVAVPKIPGKPPPVGIRPSHFRSRLPARHGSGARNSHSAGVGTEGRQWIRKCPALRTSRWRADASLSRGFFHLTGETRGGGVWTGGGSIRTTGGTCCGEGWSCSSTTPTATAGGSSSHGQKRMARGLSGGASERRMRASSPAGGITSGLLERSISLISSLGSSGFMG